MGVNQLDFMGFFVDFVGAILWGCAIAFVAAFTVIWLYYWLEEEKKRNNE